MTSYRRAPSLTVARACCAVAVVTMLAGCSEDVARPRRPDPSVPNPASIGFIDTPAAGTLVGPILRVSGWAADESGVVWVRVYADDQIIENVPLNIPRPDVEQQFPRFSRPEALHGWQTTIDFGDQVGYAHISAEALDGRGALTRFAMVTVKIRP